MVRHASRLICFVFLLLLWLSPGRAHAQENCSNYFAPQADAWMASVNYLIPEIKRVPVDQLLATCRINDPHDFSAVLERLSGHFGLPLRCISQSVLTAQRQKGVHTRGKIVGTCKTPTDTPVDQKLVPCFTDNLAYYTHSVVNSALACMHDPNDPLDFREIFALINHESNFVFDISSGGGRGLMQLTTAGVAEFLGVFDSDGKRVEGQRSQKFWLQSASNPACQQFKPVIEPHLAAKRTTRNLVVCELIGSPDTHKRNMIIGLSLYKLYRERARRLISDYLAKQPISQRPNGVDLEYMVKQLVRYMYNQGDGAGREAFFRMVASRRPLAAKTFQRDLEQAAAHFVGRDVASFPRNVDNDLAVIEGLAGTCFYN